MKKILKFLFCAMIIFALMSTCAFAAETTDAAITETSAAITETSAAITETSAATTGATAAIAGTDAAIAEMKKDLTSFISQEKISDGMRWLAMIVIYVVFNFLIFGKFKKGNIKQEDVENAVNELIGAYNQMESGYNKMAAEYEKLREAYAKYGETEGDRNRVIGAVMELCAAILEILQFAYANSSKLPQGVKDVINLKYANTLSKLSSDKELIALVEGVRKQINNTADIIVGESDEEWR